MICFRTKAERQLHGHAAFLWERCGDKTVFFPCLCLSDLDTVGQEQRSSFIQACDLLWRVSFEYLSSWIKPCLTYNEFSNHFIHLKKLSYYSFQPKERSLVLVTTKCHLGTEEMVHLVKCQPHKHEDQSSDLWHHIRPGHGCTCL